MAKRIKHRTKKGSGAREVQLQALRDIAERARTAGLSGADVDELLGAIDTLAFITHELELKGASLEKLRRLLFGATTEKTSQVVKGDAAPATPLPVSASEPSTADAPAEAPEEKETKKRKGHGRNGAESYRGAEKVPVAHGTLKRADHCPCCDSGKVYPQAEPAVLVRVTGMAPLSAKVYELDRLRCNLCGEVFTADAPEGAGDAKYDETATATAMVGLLKYGTGLPFNRIEKLQENLGIPMPAATQWELVERGADQLQSAFNELVRQGAQGEVVYNDDTNAKILELEKQRRVAEAAGEGDDRTGVFTSGIVSTGDGNRIALFFTGPKHAGENLAAMLAQRAAELPPPIQMCDALSRNTTGDFETILASCNAHARRRYVDVAESFPEECRHVLFAWRDVYRFDAQARDDAMTPDQRLRFHQENSKPVMDALQRWARQQLDDRKVEPNSGLGAAIAYMLKYWKELTLFLRVPGAPLDNNICERALKKAILHRKNALFYKTKNGARVGDLYMSLIHTAELCGADTFDYLVALLRHQDQVDGRPDEWMPWNFRLALDRLTPRSATA